MLVEFSVQNYASFNSMQTLSMLASNSTKENFNKTNVFSVNKFGIEDLVKSAAVFGANASGKTNLISSINTLKKIILESLTTAESDNLGMVLPFLIKNDVFDKPSEFEISFLHKGNLYRYGLSVLKDKINEEWLYWTKTSRETLLFHRTDQKIKINQRSFSEAKAFIKSDKSGGFSLEKTRENVPFISVLSQFDGEKSRNVIDWFSKLNIVSGISERGFKGFTTELLDSNPSFRSWALSILSSLQIQGINIVEVDREDAIKVANQDSELNDAISKVNSLIRKKKDKEKKIEIVKKSEDGEEYTIPLALESEGTRKLLYLLGPIYDVINSGEVLLIDEFDNKFHSLLSKFILETYHKENKSNSQLLITCHDTHLLTKELLRRDQIWFVEKNSKHESELYSLLEYKEHYTRKDGTYSKDYLEGKYGAIPLFKSIDELETALNV